jgi:hypothetical protein
MSCVQIAYTVQMIEAVKALFSFYINQAISINATHDNSGCRGHRRFQRVQGIAGQEPGMKLRGDSQAIASVSHVRESLFRKTSSIPTLLSVREDHRT